MSSKKDIDILETTEWLEAINSVIEEEGIERASFLLTKLAERINQEGAIPSYNLTTPFRNTISVKDEAQMPGDLFMERRIRSLIRWNALVMVLKANKNDDELGGHISTFSSAATLHSSPRRQFSIPNFEERQFSRVSRPIAPIKCQADLRLLELKKKLLY